MSIAKESARKKGDKLVDYLRGKRIEGSFNVRDGVCYDYGKYLEGTVSQMEAYEVLSLYWKTAYMRLWELRNLVG